MKPFMSEDFLLNNPTAVELYEKYAKNAPIIDYHCHINPQEIYEDRKFENIAQVWLGGKQVKDGKVSYAGDHYKWRLMRAAGVSEDYILGDQDDYLRFKAFCKTLEKCIGNPMIHWCQLELKKYFNCTLPICEANAKEIWDMCNEKLLNDPKCTARGLIISSNVKFIGTTDDPIDSLEWHKLIQEDESFDVVVAPSYRPDKALNIHQATFVPYIKQLADVSEIEINTIDDLMEALHKRLVYFVERGCKVSDHGLEYMPNQPYSKEIANLTLVKALNHEPITVEEKDTYCTYVQVELGKLYKKYHVVVQYHYNALRNTNQRMFEEYGVDTGYDAMNTHNCIQGVQNILSLLSYNNECPKTILYSLNPSDFDSVGVLAGCFQTNADVASRVQLGAAWWFNDTRDGMETQLKTLARVGILGSFVGMLTDSRSFLSYTRHDYFRRILCNLIGKWVEDGEFYYNEAILQEIVEGICYTNAKEYFEL